jgi:hypothetical protein
MFRRKELPTELRPIEAAFVRTLEELEPAKVAITDAVPGARLPGRPFHDALDAFERGLVGARGAMDGWRHPLLEREWLACDDGLDEAISRARRAREIAVDVIGFEAMLGVVEDLIDPLDPFADAEARFRELRRRDGGGRG